jgi:hypothetical protein
VAKSTELVDQLAILVATARALILNKAATPLLLDTYDSASSTVLNRLRDTGFSAEELMQLERNLARLRTALADLAQGRGG